MSAGAGGRAARRIAGATVAVLAAAVVAALIVVPLPGSTVEPVSISARPPAAASLATCAGPILAAGRDSSNAASLTDAAAQAVTAAAADGAGDLERSTLGAPDVTDGAGPASLTVPPAGDAPVDLAAAGSAAVAAPDLRGFAATSCGRPAMESWLVGGDATTGAADLVVLANPGDVAAEVTLVVYGATGPSSPAAGSGIVVPAGTQRVIPLASLALGEEAPVVRVTASQAPVRATLQTSITRVLTPGGVDQVAASAVPSSTITIPGVAIALAPDDPAASDVPTRLRLLAPAADGTATVTIRAASGPVGAEQTVPLTAGVPLELDFAALAVGTYTVDVTSTTPVTGAVWSTTGFDAGSDFAWFAAADTLTGPALVAVARGASPVLTLASTGAEDQTVTLTSDAGAGAPREITLPAGGVVAVPVASGAVYRIIPGDAGVAASVAYASTGALAGYPVPPGDTASAAIRVYPR